MVAAALYRQIRGDFRLPRSWRKIRPKEKDTEDTETLHKPKIVVTEKLSLHCPVLVLQPHDTKHKIA